MAFGAGRLVALVGADVKSDPEVDSERSPRRVQGWQVGVVIGKPLWRCGQAMAQVVPVWCSPSVVSRRRFRAAARWCSQWLFVTTPR